MDNTKQIGDRTFSFGTIPAFEAIKVEIAIARVIGEPLFKAFMDAKQPGAAEQDAEEAAKQAGAAAIGLLCANMKADELLETMKTVFQYVTCDGKRVDINATFTGRNKEVWQVFIAALRFNFSDFFPESLFASIRGAVTTK